jgi:hypothetical protein
MGPRGSIPAARPSAPGTATRRAICLLVHNVKEPRRVFPVYSLGTKIEHNLAECKQKLAFPTI